MSVELLTEHHLEFLSLIGGYRDFSDSTLVKMPHCWKSRVTAHLWMLGRERAIALRAQNAGISDWSDFQQCGMCDQQRLRPACSYVQTDQGLCYSLEYSMIVKRTEQHLEFLSSKGDCTGRSESTLVTCWKPHVAAQNAHKSGQKNVSKKTIVFHQKMVGSTI